VGVNDQQQQHGDHGCRIGVNFRIGLGNPQQNGSENNHSSFSIGAPSTSSPWIFSIYLSYSY